MSAIPRTHDHDPLPGRPLGPPGAPGPLATIFEHHPDPVAFLDIEERVLGVNPAFVRCFPHQRSTGGFKWFEVLDGRSGLQPRILESGSLQSGGVRRVTVDDESGTARRYRVSIVPLEREIEGAVAYAHFEPETEPGSRLVVRSGHVVNFRGLVDTMGHGIVVSDIDDRVRYVNARTTEITGYTADELMGSDAGALFLHPDEMMEHAFRADRRSRGEPQLYETRHICNGGGINWVEVNETALFGNDGKRIGTIRVVADVSERRCAMESLEALTITDELTGLANRRGFFSQAEVDWVVAMAKSDEMMLIFADMDGFKEINDVHGHAEGDRALRDVAQLLQSIFRTDDVIERVAVGSTVARFGGDEFVILLNGTEDADETNIRRRIERTLKWFNRTQGRPYTLEMSVGIVRARPRDGMSFEEAVREADKQMYETKREKREKWESTRLSV